MLWVIKKIPEGITADSQPLAIATSFLRNVGSYLIYTILNAFL